MGALISDIDVVADVRKIGGGGQLGNFGFSVEGPTGTEVLLRDPEIPKTLPQVFFDDEATQGAELLEAFDGEPSTLPPDEWTLWLKNSVHNPDDIVVELRRLEVRLHHEGVTECSH
jgi:hypothetical protein